MAIQKKKPNKRVRNLIFITTLTAIILIVSTYAWFVGMRTVNVSDFDVEIAATESLMLSLNGEDWADTISISKATINSASYAGNTNHWGDKGLFPVSSVGDMDPTVSRMKLFEKASLTTTPGGYRLMASRVNNYEANGFTGEQDGYVAFDLFVRNFSGTQYIKDYDPLDEEAIYLTNDSNVTVAADGVADTGIENSVRIAFGQIGRISGVTDTTDPLELAKVTGITCEDDPLVDDSTGICGQRVAQIWEPNDTDHVDDALSWYETSCLARTGANVTAQASYSGPCEPIVDGIAYPTYAVKQDITSANNVDVYDGAEYNTYTGTTMLEAYDYFTDTMKLKRGVERPTFMTLAPNSITKIRIYIYIEGQDIDNYDFASIGKKITVKFGFTKERYTEDDINYNGPDLNQGTGPAAGDKTPPVITLTGANPLTLTQGTAYVEPGVAAEDVVNGVTTDLTGDIVTTGVVNVNVPGEYRKLYTVKDAAGNTATKVRRVIITP